MIYQKMDLTIRLEWLDPENVDKQKRKALVVERLLKMFSHEIAEEIVNKHGIKIEVVAINGKPIVNDREIKEPKRASSSNNNN